MIPQTLLALVAFLFLVAPGILFEVLQERRRPARTETAFREASRTALASLTFSLAATLLLAGVSRWRVPGLVPDIARWAAHPPGYLQTAGATSTIIRFVVLELVAASTLAALADLVLARRRATIHPTRSGWWQMFREDLPPGGHPYVRVLLTDGTEYRGTLVLHTLELDLAERELVLGPPLTWKPPTGSEPTQLEGSWQRVCITGSAIQTVMAAYIPQADALAPFPTPAGPSGPPASSDARPNTRPDGTETGSTLTPGTTP